MFVQFKARGIIDFVFIIDHVQSSSLMMFVQFIIDHVRGIIVSSRLCRAPLGDVAQFDAFRIIDSCSDRSH